MMKGTLVLTSFIALFHPCSCITNEDELLDPRRTSSSLSALSFNSLRKTEASSGNNPKVWAISERRHYHQNGNHITGGRAYKLQLSMHLRPDFGGTVNSVNLPCTIYPGGFSKVIRKTAQSVLGVCFINTSFTHALHSALVYWPCLIWNLVVLN